MTIREVREALIAELEAAGLAATSIVGAKPPPYVLVSSGGIPDPGTVVRGSMLAEFRCICVAGRMNTEAGLAELDELKMAVLAAVRPLAGWAMRPVERDTVRTYQGAEYLTADIGAAHYVDI